MCSTDDSEYPTLHTSLLPAKTGTPIRQDWLLCTQLGVPGVDLVVEDHIADCVEIRSSRI